MKNIVIKGWVVAAAVIVVMFGGIYLTIGTGHWATTREKEPVKLESGEYSPADIRGSYAFSELEQFFGVPTNVLFEAFLIPEGLREPTFLIKNMEDLFAPVVIDGTEIEVGTDLLRVFTSLHSGIPYESDETTHLPSSAIKMLIQEQKLDADQQVYWQAHTFELVPADGEPEGEVVAEEQEEAEVSIKGGTTIGELIDYGLTEEQFKEITGMEVPSNRALGLRDFVTQNSLDMETVKTALEELLLPATEETSPVEEQPPAAESTEPQPAESSIEIKGSTTIGTLLDYGLTSEQFKELTGLDVPEDRTMMFKDFAEANGLDVETVKTQIQELLLAVDKETAPMEAPSPVAEPASTTETEPVEQEPPAEVTIDIKGSTTIGTVLDSGLTAEQFKEITGLDVPEDTAMKLKDFADANSLDMETIRTKITDALAQ